MQRRLATMACAAMVAVSMAACGSAPRTAVTTTDRRAVATVGSATVPTVAPATAVPGSAATTSLATSGVAATTATPAPTAAATTKQTAKPKTAQTISAQPIAGWTYGAIHPVQASASSGLPVQLASASGSCVVENPVLLTLKATGVGTCAVRLTQDDVAGQFQHAELEVSYNVDLAEQKVTGLTTQFRLNVTTIANGRTTYNLQAAAPTPVQFISRAAGDDCTVIGSVLSVRNYVWSCPVTAVAGESPLYKKALLDAVITILPQIVTVSVAVKTGPVAGQWTVRAVEMLNGVGRVLTTGDTGCTAVSASANGIVASVPAGQQSCTIAFNVGLEDGLREKDCKQANLPTGTVTPCN